MRLDGDIKVQAGKLRHPIAILSLGPTSPPTTNSAGPVLAWQPFAVNVRAAIGQERASDTLKDGQGAQLIITPISLRFMPGVKQDMRVVGQNGTYTVQAVKNVDERNWLLELECVLIGPGQ